MKLWQKGLLALALLLVFGAYLHFMNPVFKNNDSPETTAAAMTLGIGHPPGYPLHAILGKAWSVFMPFGNPAFRMNVLAAALGLACLLVFFGIVRNILRNIQYGSFVFPLLLVLALAFSYIFWNQSMEAKGGIYMLHQLFMLALTFLGMRMLDKFSARDAFMASFILGLSLANHWPSVAVAMPAFLIVFVMNFRRFTFKRTALCAAFMFLGLTPYLYLVIRALGAAVLNWGDPSNINNLLWVILRKAYAVPVDATVAVFTYQVKEFIRLLITDYMGLIAPAIFGIYAAFRDNRKAAVFLLTMFISITAAVVLYNRTQEGVIWLIHIFLMPAFTVLGVFMAYAVKFYAIGPGQKKAHLYIFAAVLSAMLVHMAYANALKNNFSRDYLSYDYGYNLLANIRHNEAYAADGDHNLMPVYYITEIQKRRTDVKFATASFLIFEWGIKDFENKFGPVDGMKPFDSEGNIAKVALHYSETSAVYRSRFLPRLDKFTALSANDYGILLKLEEGHRVYPASIHSLYFYRNFFEPHATAYKNNRDLITWYPVSMVNHGNALLRAGKPEEALKLYKMSLAFPVEKPLGNIYFSMALAYAALKDKLKEAEALYRAFKAGYRDRSMLESLGIKLYSMLRLSESQDVLTEAVNMGSTNGTVQKALQILNGMSEEDKLETALQKANEYMSKENYKEAEPIYKYLLEKKYKTGIILLNTGVFYFKTNNMDLAIDYFGKSLNETKTPEGYLYLGYSYFNKGKKAEAINTLRQGIKQYPDDARLKELEGKILKN